MGLTDEADVAKAEVAQSAVDQLRGRARRLRAEVGPVHQRDRKPCTGGLARDSRANDSSADDEHVEAARLELL
jgi:hypothetical protein